jgi:SRSO17 transposase
LSNETASLPVGYRLYLPEAWAKDPERRKAAGVPEDVVFQTKWEIAHGLIDEALAAGRPKAPVGADAGYGNTFEFRAGLTARHLEYIVGIESTTGVWPPGQEPPAPKPWSGRGRPPTVHRRDGEHQPVSVLEFARSLPETAFTEVGWRDGTKGEQSSRFAAERVRPSHKDGKRGAPHPEEWLLIEWPAGEKNPTKYWLSTLSAAMPICDLVFQAKLRWRIERDFLELKDEIGMDHYEGRSWRGFTITAAYASQPTRSWWPRGPSFPPSAHVAAKESSRCLLYPEASDQGVPARTQRHQPMSIATMKIRIAHALVHGLELCPTCRQPTRQRSRPRRIQRTVRRL